MFVRPLVRPVMGPLVRRVTAARRGRASLSSQVAALMASFAGPAKLWLDPWDITTLQQDSAGTTPVTAAGDPIGRIMDKSGAANHCIQATTTSRPLWQATFGAFDGTDDSWASAASIDFTSTDKVTVIAGLRKATNAGRSQFLELGASGAVAGSFGMTVPEDATGALSAARNGGLGAGATNSSALAAPLTCVESVGFDLAGTTHATQTPVFRVNGAAASVSNAGLANTGQGPFGNLPLNIGRRNGVSFPFNGNLYGLIIIGRLLAAPELTLCEQYMAQQAGIAL